MTNKARLVMAGLAIAMMGLVGMTAPPATADSQDCQPDVYAKNEKESHVKVLNFKYKIEGSGETFTEDLLNTVLGKGGSKTWESQKLKYAVKGVKITSTAVTYQDDTGRGWGSDRTSAWFPHTFKCGDNHTYNQTIR